MWSELRKAQTGTVKLSAASASGNASSFFGCAAPTRMQWGNASHGEQTNQAATERFTTYGSPFFGTRASASAGIG
jgi:hypothetical protein